MIFYFLILLFTLLCFYVIINFAISEYSLERHKKVFDTFAKNHEFDPLVPENWGNASKESICEEQVSSSPSLNFL